MSLRPEDEDEAWVEDGEDPYMAVNDQETEEPSRQNPIMAFFEDVMHFLLAYFSNPWVILLCAVGAYMLYQRLVKPRVLDVGATYQSWMEQRQQAAEDAAHKRDPDLYRQRMEAMQMAREKQQAEYDEAARQFAEKEREKEEKKRLEKLQQLENLRNGKGYNNKSDQSSSKQNKLKSDDYSPLMGGSSSSDGASCGYRPARRGFSSGGGGWG